MKKLREQTDAKIATGRKNNPEFMKEVDVIINEAKAFQKGENAIKIGKKAPSFELPNAEKKVISLDGLLNKGPLVITFYRGDWCPYCNLQFKALHDRLDEIHALGAKVIAISPQVPDGSLTASEISKMEFTLLSDQDAKVATEYGVSWEVPAFLTEHMRVDRNLDLDKINNGNTSILPIPATFILDGEGIVKWNYVNVDYRIRSEPEEVIEVLKKLA